jgi:hypothetical protein
LPQIKLPEVFEVTYINKKMCNNSLVKMKEIHFPTILDYNIEYLIFPILNLEIISIFKIILIIFFLYNIFYTQTRFKLFIIQERI